MNDDEPVRNQSVQLGRLQTFHVKAALEINGTIHLIETSASLPEGSKDFRGTVERAALSVAKKAEGYLVGYGLVTQ